MGRAAGKTHGPIGEGEPVDDACWRHGVATLRLNDRSVAARKQAPGSEGGLQRRVQRNTTAAVLLSDAVVQLDHQADFAGRAYDHIPGQVGNLASTQACLERQQNDQVVAVWISSSGGKDEEVV